jgi:hypothetical protein
MIWIELWLDSMFPLLFHDVMDPSFAQLFPSQTETAAAHVFKSFVNKDPAAQSTWNSIACELSFTLIGWQRWD